MRISRVCTVYFSATGTTRRTAKAAADAAAALLGVPQADFCINLPQTREETLRYLDSVKKMGLGRQAVLALVEDLWAEETGGEER